MLEVACRSVDMQDNRIYFLMMFYPALLRAIAHSLALP